ncbi:MAG: TetR family transcriptional regulator [Actinophytocola sp.]|uniref:TetR/AcrR family transcriptional regulator n=1 Tax=Actinophytocola sp. TaxID=1872138 RepID=UPI001325891F|nr:TetR/AcrR family transcriptional regulator [Actinophytocola sp.]MPZ83744.1 TetR family transcriptional regulator [Actinophytocola sp.]
MATEEYHALRRRQVAEAVERLIAQHGLDGVTVAKTAAEAGVSVGLVQHYFATKDDMLRYAYTRVTERTMARVLRRADELTAHRSSIRRVVAEGLTERLPLDDARRAEWRVSFTFAARAVDRPDLAAVRNETEAAIRDRLAEAIGNGKECGEVPPDADPPARAAGLLALVDGLALLAYLDPATGPVAVAELDRHLATVFPGRCRQYDRPNADTP